MQSFTAMVQNWLVHWLSAWNSDYPSLIIILTFLALTVYRRDIITKRIVVLLSKFLDACLYMYYPLRHIETGDSLPTCQYQWPNGQGNVAKFLEGMENSSRWSEKYGGIYRIWSGMTPEIVLTKPEHVKLVFYDSDKHRKATDNNSGFLFGQLLGQCVGLISRSNWEILKTAMEFPFLHSAVNGYVDLVQRSTQEYIDELYSRGNLQNGLLDPVQDIKMLPFWIVAEIIYGTLDATMKQQLEQIVPQREEVFKHAVRGGISRFRVSQYLPLATTKELASFKSFWKSFNRSALERALSISPICKMYVAVSEGIVSEEQLLQTLDEMLFANLDVTMGGISWNLVFLASNPRVQEQLRGEILEQINMHGKQEQNSTKYLLRSSSYLAACILESARLKPLAAFSVPQSAPTERVIDGFKVPGGTNFIIDSHALNIRNAFWGSDTAVYRPERFLERKGPLLRYNYWRFGFGPRQCMGKYLADLIIRALLVQMVEAFDLNFSVAEEDWMRAAETWIYHPKIKLRCIRRTKI